MNSIKLKIIIVSIVNYITIFLTLLGYKSLSHKYRFDRLGSQYGGWWIPKKLQKPLNLDEGRRILVSAGIGDDISFDLEMLKLGFELIALDPLPRCAEFAKKSIPNSYNSLIISKGLWDHSGHAKFFWPRDKSHDSFSITNLQNVPETEFVGYQTLDIFDLFTSEPRLMDVNNYVYLKMDVEGAELSILNRMIEKNIEVNMLAVEFDVLSLIPVASFRHRYLKIKDCRKILKNLKISGYTFAFNEKYNFFWEGKPAF